MALIRSDVGVTIKCYSCKNIETVYGKIVGAKGTIVLMLEPCLAIYNGGTPEKMDLAHRCGGRAELIDKPTIVQEIRLQELNPPRIPKPDKQ